MIFGDNFPTIFGDNFKAIFLKLSVRFTLKELRCKLSSSFYSDYEEGDILLLQKGVMFEIKKKNKSKRKHRVPEFFHNQEEKRPFNKLIRNKTSR